MFWAFNLMVFMEIMAEIVESCNMNNTSPSENAVYIKKEYIDENHVDEKVFVCETVEISCNGLEDYVNEDRIIQHEVVTVDNIKTTINGNVKVEDEISLAHDIKNELNNQELFCSQCCRDYQDYCIKCGMLIYILNRNVLSNTYNDARQEIPKNILEIRESFGHFGMFTLKVIPEGVKFGPFTGLSDTEDSWKIKGGKFMVDNDKLEFLNWMQFINSAKTIFEQNLLIYQCGNDLYYRSSREIQIGEELLVYFGEKYEDSVNTEVEMDFIPDIDNDDRNVFACTFCCLGFCSEEYLFKHKTICPNLFNEKPLLEVLDLMQCLFCEIFLEKVEYLEHHMDYCRMKNSRDFMLPSPEDEEMELETDMAKQFKCSECDFKTKRNSCLKVHMNAKHLKEVIFKCLECEYKTNYKSNLEVHIQAAHRKETNHNCLECDYKTNYLPYLKAHINRKHVQEKIYECPKCEYKTQYKHRLPVHLITHEKMKQFKCLECEFETKNKYCLKRHTKTKHLKESSYKCMQCDFDTNYKKSLEAHINATHNKKISYNCTECDYRTNYEPDLKVHIKGKHLHETTYKCTECDFGTNYKYILKAHVDGKHLKKSNYKCSECGFETSYKYNLKVHINGKHRKQTKYKCVQCEFETNYKQYLEVHMKIKHSTEASYKCMECEYKTNHKPNLEVHVKTKHLGEANYKCIMCEYKTNYKSLLKRHINIKHVEGSSYKCMECEFETNYRYSLEAHINGKHLKETNYNCTECQFKTNYKKSLNAHVKAKHSEKSELKSTEC